MQGLARLANVSDQDDIDDAGGGRFPNIPGLEGYATVTLGDGIETVPTAGACVRILKDSAGGLGREVVHTGLYGTRPKTVHWGEALMNMPNPWMTGTQFWRWVFGDIYARGEAFVYIERNAMGDPVSLLPARVSSSGYAPFLPRPVAQQPSQYPVWVSVPTGGSFSFAASQIIPTTAADVLHFTDESYDPFRGRARSPLACKVRNPIGIYKLVISRYLALLVNAGHADRYMETDDVGYEHYLKAKKNRDAGPTNANDILPIPEGSKLHQSGRSAIEMQTIEVLTWLDPRICMAWGVPLFALGIEQQGGRGVRQDLREQYQQFLRSGFQTQVRLVEEEFNRKVLARARGFRCRFKLEELTIGTLEQRATVVNILVQRTGVLTPNEGREIMGLPPLPGEDANTLRAVTGAPAPDSDGKQNGDQDEDATEDAKREIATLLGDSWRNADLSDPSEIELLKSELAAFESDMVQ